jgi:universal stress protein E
MKKPRRLLFAVKNPESRSHAVVDKVIRIAKDCGASLEFFNAIAAPVFLEVQPLTGHSLADLKRETLALRRARLEKLAARARKHGVTAHVAVEWDYPPHEAIVRQVKRTGADLVIAECHRGHRLAPWLVHVTDWELLREAPVPVLLIKNTRPWRRPNVLAAVDPLHEHAKPARLDDLIVDHAQMLARTLGGGFELVHANFPSLMLFSTGDAAMDAEALNLSFEAHKADDRRVFDEFADRRRIPLRHRHLQDGDPRTALPRLARRFRAGVMVMGAVSRSGLKRVFIGNTAELVLDQLPCDVLVVKPAHFERPVAPRNRGMNVVASPSLLPLPV